MNDKCDFLVVLVFSGGGLVMQNMLVWGVQWQASQLGDAVCRYIRHGRTIRDYTGPRRPASSASPAHQTLSARKQKHNLFSRCPPRERAALPCPFNTRFVGRNQYLHAQVQLTMYLCKIVKMHIAASNVCSKLRGVYSRSARHTARKHVFCS